MVQGRRIQVRGTVQGVGFRPWVYRLALEEGIRVRVRNDAKGVTIEAFGGPAALDAFLRRLRTEAPPAARVREVEEAPTPAETVPDFAIVPSEGAGVRRVSIPPDLATCPECRREVHEPGERRHLYPFTNCTSSLVEAATALDFTSSPGEGSTERPAETLLGSVADLSSVHEPPAATGRGRVVLVGGLAFLLLGGAAVVAWRFLESRASEAAARQQGEDLQRLQLLARETQLDLARSELAGKSYQKARAQAEAILAEDPGNTEAAKIVAEAQKQWPTWREPQSRRARRWPRATPPPPRPRSPGSWPSTPGMPWWPSCRRRSTRSFGPGPRPSKSVKLHSADSAIVCWGIDRTSKRMYFRDSKADKMYPDELIDRALTMVKRFNAVILAVEVTSLEQFIVQPFKNQMLQKGVHPRFLELKAVGKKEERVSTLAPHYRHGYVYHNRAICGKLETQLLGFPKSKRWDVMDAAAYITKIMEEEGQYFDPIDAGDPLESEFSQLENEKP